MRRILYLSVILLLLLTPYAYAERPEPGFASCDIAWNGSLNYSQHDGDGTCLASTPMLLELRAGESLTLPTDRYHASIAYYRSDGSFLSLEEDVSEALRPTEDTYIRIRLRAAEPLTEQDFEALERFAAESLRSAEQPPAVYQPLRIVSSSFMYYPTGIQDGISVNGELWMFVSSEYGGKEQIIYRIDPETGEQYESRKHNLGHCNTLDRDPQTDTLLTVANLKGGSYVLMLYRNVSTAEKLLVTDEAAICIPFTRDDGLESNINAVFRDSTHIYFAYSDSKGSYIRPVELGTGENDLSACPNGMGAYTPAAEGDYNGTFKMGEPLVGPPFYVAQGMCYGNGRIYMSYGHSRLAILELETDEQAGTYRIVREYMAFHPADENRYYNCKIEPETCVFAEDRLYLGVRECGGHVGTFAGWMYLDTAFAEDGYTATASDCLQSIDLTLETDDPMTVYVNCRAVDVRNKRKGLIVKGQTILYAQDPEGDPAGGTSAWSCNGTRIGEDACLIIKLKEDTVLRYGH